MLEPIETTNFSRRATNVRVYLDDLENLLVGLSQFGNPKVTASHRGGARSHVTDLKGLEDREDILGVTIDLAKGLIANVEVSVFSVEVWVDQTAPQVWPTCNHFVETLEPVKPSPFRRLVRPRLSSVDLRLERRRVTRDRREKIKLELISGLIGAALGVAATLLVVLLQ